SSWNGVGAIAKVPAAWAVSLVIWCLYPSSSFRDGPKDQTADAQSRIGESRGSGFTLRVPRNDNHLNLRADFLISSSEKNISLEWLTISSAFHPANGGVQPSISIMRISRTPRGPETPSTLPVWSPDKSETMYSTAGAMPSGPRAAPGFSL